MSFTDAMARIAEIQSGLVSSSPAAPPAPAQPAATPDGRSFAQVMAGVQKAAVPAVPPAPASGPVLEGTRPNAQIETFIQASASKHGVDADLLRAQLYQESKFDTDAVSPAGAQGIAQFMPGTAAAVGLRDPFDPQAAIDAQAKHMRDLLDQFDGSIDLALAAYNAGPGNVTKYGGVPPFTETQNYVRNINALMRGYKNGE